MLSRDRSLHIDDHLVWRNRLVLEIVCSVGLGLDVSMGVMLKVWFGRWWG